MNDYLLYLDRICKEYRVGKNKFRALNNISFGIYEGEFVSIMGHSGSGKTTLLNCIATLDNATKGMLWFKDKQLLNMSEDEIAEYRKKEVGVIFQNYSLLSNLNVYENIAFALTINRFKYNKVDALVKDIAERVCISDLLKKYPIELSGGQQQKVAIARALVKQPSLILADEPTGALDSFLAQNIIELFSNINKELNTTILMVTHNPVIASKTDRVLNIYDGKLVDEVRKSDIEFFDVINGFFKS